MTAILALALSLALASPAAAAGLRPLARELSAAARAAGLTRVAVLSFAPADASAAGDGPVIAERLLGEIVRSGRVSAVERSRLSGLLDEQSLGRSGLLDPAGLRRLGRVLSADAVVLGSFTSRRGRTRVLARLVDAETGAIIGAAEADLARDWTGPSPSDCADAASRSDALEGSVLELKARLWSRRLREGLSFADAAPTPGTEIADLDLRWSFYDRVSELYASREDTPLSAEELTRLESAEREARGLRDNCVAAR